MTNIVPGAFFVLNGVMLFIAEVGETEYRKTTVRKNKRERLRCIFENGTESSMYRQSLAIRLSDEDGQIVVQSELTEILTDDEVSGCIYVLRSRSEDPQLAGIKDLHKRHRRLRLRREDPEARRAWPMGRRRLREHVAYPPSWPVDEAGPEIPKVPRHKFRFNHCQECSSILKRPTDQGPAGSYACQEDSR